METQELLSAAAASARPSFAGHGSRITEALRLRVTEIDFDNLLITLDGKGRKQRVVPFSFELKKALFRYIRDCGRKPGMLLLASGNETMLGRRVVLRDMKLLCKRLGFDPPVRTLHAFRHTFAVNYLRRYQDVLPEWGAGDDVGVARRLVALEAADSRASAFVGPPISTVVVTKKGIRWINKGMCK